MGTPQFAVPTLELLSKTQYCPVLCITQPDKLKGRKQKLLPPEVKIKAVRLGIPVIQPQDVNEPDIIAKLANLKPDIVITVAYGSYLKKAIRKLPVYGCINLHPSLLPKYRGAAPINYALFNGDTRTGVTVFKIVAKMDAGPVISQKETEILKDECYTELSTRLAQMGAEEIMKALKKIEKNGLLTTPQDHKSATFTHKLQKKDLIIDWNQPAERIRNKIRGLAEIPGAVASFRKSRIKIVELEILKTNSGSVPGTIINIKKNQGIVTTSGDFDVLLKRVQPAGKKIMTSYAFSLGARIKPEEKFENGF
jgi:methionyl-tRNA formyltransferase